MRAALTGLLRIIAPVPLREPVDPAGARRHASLARSLVNAKALVLGHGGQERDEAAAEMGVVKSKCGLSSTLMSAPLAWMRSMSATPSIMWLEVGM